jgi:hypothetical protein
LRSFLRNRNAAVTQGLVARPCAGGD